VDPAGNVLLAAINCVFRVEGSTIYRVAGNSRGGFSGDGGPAIAAQLGLSDFSPSGGLTLDAAGNIYIADSGSARIRKISASGIITTIAGNGTITLSGDGGPAVNGSVGNPVALALDGSGNLFVADWAYGTVRKISPDGIIRIVAGGGGAAVVNGAAAISIRLLHPTGLAVDGSGNLFIADTGNNSIREVSHDGIITTIAGTGTTGFSGDGARRPLRG
jgi:sugar lactone lactonase YvrE